MGKWSIYKIQKKEDWVDFTWEKSIAEFACVYKLGMQEKILHTGIYRHAQL